MHLSASVREKRTGRFQMNLTSAVGVLTASGLVNDLLGQPQVDLAADLTTDLAAVSRISPEMPNLDGTLCLTLSGRGPVNDPTARLQVAGQHLAMAPNVQNGSLDIAVSLAGRVLTLERARTDLLGITTTISGSTDLSRVFPDGFLGSAPDLAQMTYALAFDQTGGDFARLAPWMPGFSGQFSSRGRAQGRGISLDTLTAGYDLTSTFKEFKQNQAENDPLDLTIQVSGDITRRLLTLSQLNLDTRPAQLQGSGTYHLADQVLDMGVTVSADDLDAATRAFGLFPARGRVSATVQAQGPVSGPAIAAVLEGRDLEAAGMVVDWLDLKATLDGQGKAALTDLTVQGPGLELAASGTADLFDPGFALKKQIQAFLKTKGKIRPATVLAETDPKMAPLFLNTDTAFDLEARVAYDRGASLSIPDISEMTIPRQSLAARIDLDNPRFSLVLENLVDITGDLEMKTSGYAVDLDFKAKDFGPLLSAAGLPGVSGGVQGWFRSSGTLPEDLMEPFETHLAAAKGRVTIEADVAGTVLQPEFNAVMNVTDLAWQPEDLPLAVTGVNGRMTLSQDRLTIHELTTQINQGA